MFILYAIPIGLALGLLLGGRVESLSGIGFRWAWLAVAGLMVQVGLFSPPVVAIVGDAGPPIYVASTAAVLVAVLRNLQVPGIPLVALGAGSNLVAIAANGGYMPADPVAYTTLGRGPIEGYSNSVLDASPNLAPLTDIFVLPTWVPFANVFSIGDVLLAIGVSVVIVAAMRRAAPGPSPVPPPGPSTGG